MLEEIQDLLRRHMGLDTASLGPQALARAVRERQSACGVSDGELYRARLMSDPAELQELVEAVIVPETWFFRDAPSFAALTREAERWLSAQGAGVLRLLSLPCASGEEPYSMVMALLDAGFPAQRFAVDALDISERALRHARRAEYGNNSFRGEQLAFRDRHFHACAAGYRLSDEVRSKVQFRAANLFASGILAGSEHYDIIFCRNVLIYFDAQAQQQTIGLLAGLLRGEGLLFVGASETGILWNGPFVSTREPFAFAFRKTTPRSAPAVARRTPWKPVHVAPAIVASTTAARPPAVAVLHAAPASRLDEAAMLANRGLLRDAAQACAEHLRSHPPCARSFHLLALLSEASGDDQAAIAYHRKALYLEPNHEEALTHLALLLQKQGDAAGAERLLRRAERLTRQGGA
jgi:chemotaxis protein methyltransferase WspC